MLCIQYFLSSFSKQKQKQKKKQKKKTNFSGKFKLKPIISYTYNFFYKNIVNIALLYIFIIFF